MRLIYLAGVLLLAACATVPAPTPLRQAEVGIAFDRSGDIASFGEGMADLRAGLCHCLGKYGRRQSGPQGLTVLTVRSDLEIFEEIRRLRGIAEGRRTD